MGDRVAVMSAGRPAAGRHAAAALRPAGEPVRRRLHRLAADEPDRGARAVEGDASCSRSASSGFRARRRARALPGLRAPTGADRGRPARRGSPSASDRPDLPTLTARLELVEALGSESIAYFRIDAMAIRPEGVDEEPDDEMEGEGVTAARPNFVASIPAESAYGLGIDTDVPIAVDAAKLHAFDAETGAPLR